MDDCKPLAHKPFLTSVQYLKPLLICSTFLQMPIRYILKQKKVMTYYFTQWLATYSNEYPRCRRHPWMLLKGQGHLKTVLSIFGSLQCIINHLLNTSTHYISVIKKVVLLFVSRVTGFEVCPGLRHASFEWRSLWLEAGCCVN